MSEVTNEVRGVTSSKIDPITCARAHYRTPVGKKISAQSKQKQKVKQAE